MTTKDLNTQVVGGQVCTEDSHVYPTIYAGDPQYADDYFSKCMCGKKRKITTVKEIDV